MTWFGYKIHLLVDTKYEMPIGYAVTRASASDTKHLLPLVEEVKKKHLEISRDIDKAAADKGYDSEEGGRKLRILNNTGRRVTLECEKWRQLSSTVFVNPVDASLDRTFTLRPASYRLPFSKKEGHRKWLVLQNA